MFALILILLGLTLFFLDGGFGIPSIFSKTDAGFIAIWGFPIIGTGLIIWIVELCIKKK